MNKKLLLTICFIFLPLSTLAAGQVRVRAQVNTDSVIYTGDTFGYYVVLEGADAPGEVDISPLSEYSPKFNSNRDMSRSSITIINGKRTESVEKRYVMIYSLLANKSGTLSLPGVNVKFAGKVYKTQPISVNVVEPAKSDKFELELAVSNNKCYTGEPVEVSIKWYIDIDLVKQRLVDPGRVSLNLPVFDNGAFSVERVINEPHALNNKKNYVSMRLNDRNVPFAQRSLKRKGTEWVELSYSAVIIAKNIGRVLIKPGRVLADIPVSRDFFSGTRFKRFMAQSEGAELEVIPLPDVDRPKEAYGLVGNYTISASAVPTTVDVGQPITLTVKVGGSRLLKSVRRPDIENMDSFADSFKISSQREDPVVKDGEKIFTMTVRAVNDSIKEIPAIPLVFFDTDKGEYVTAKSKPVPLTVNPSDVVTIGDVEFTGKGPVGSHVEALKKGLAANVVDIKLTSQEFSPLAAIVSPGYLSLWGVPFAAFIISVVVRLLTNTSDAKIAASKRRKARKNAEGMLKAAKSKQDTAAAMRQYVGWRFGKSSGALTGTDCERIISEATGDDQIAKEYRSILEKCEAAQYTGSSGSCDPDEINNIINIISRIDKKS